MKKLARRFSSGMTLIFLVSSSACSRPQDEAKAAYATGQYDRAAKLYQVSAEKGNAEAQYALGHMYDEGLGMARDRAAAAEWFRKAAAQGHLQAQFDLGVMYANGDGVSRDCNEALRLYRQAAEKGHAAAQVNLGVLYLGNDCVKQDYATAMTWLRKAADQGDSDAQFKIGVSFDEGIGVPKNPDEAAKWLRKAADQNHDGAQLALGMKYTKGDGVAKDVVEAYKWFLLASRKNPESNAVMALLAVKMSSEQIAEAQRRADGIVKNAGDASRPAEVVKSISRGLLGIELGDTIPEVDKKIPQLHLYGKMFTWKGEEWKHYRAMDPSKVSYANRSEYDKEEAKVKRTYECENDSPFKMLRLQFVDGRVGILTASYRSTIRPGDAHDVRLPSEMIPYYSPGTNYRYGEYVSDSLNDIVGEMEKKYGKPSRLQNEEAGRYEGGHDQKITIMQWDDARTTLELTVTLRQLNLPASGLSWDASVMIGDKNVLASIARQGEEASRKEGLLQQQSREDRRNRLVP